MRLSIYANIFKLSSTIGLCLDTKQWNGTYQLKKVFSVKVANKPVVKHSVYLMAPQTNKLLGSKILRQYDEYDVISFDFSYRLWNGKYQLYWNYLVWIPEVGWWNKLDSLHHFCEISKVEHVMTCSRGWQKCIQNVLVQMECCLNQRVS